MDELTKVINEIENINDDVIRVIKYSDLILFLNYIKRSFTMQETKDDFKDDINKIIYNTVINKIDEIECKIRNMIKFNITGKK